MLVDERELTQDVGRIEALLEEIESFPDPDLRAKVTEIVQGLLNLYGEGLTRILALVEQNGGPAGENILDALVEDELVAHLLLLHDLHPIDIETRVARALEEVRPYLKSHGGNVELLGIEDGIARLRLQGSCSGCPSSTMTLKLAIEEALLRAAPDLEGIEAEGVAEPPPRPINFLPASDILSLKERRAATQGPAWVVVDGPASLASGALQVWDVSGASLLFLKVDGALYAYRNACPGCGDPIERGVFRGTELACPACGKRYDVHQAGRCLDDATLHMEPVPLLVRNGTVKVTANHE
jgi:Fe-S cluster biogenesis protein NfuA/nitrite reductase/ring-hydroxylating ferredoxin subunit